MPSCFADYPAVYSADLGTTDTSDAPHEGPVVMVPVAIPVEELKGWAAAYDASNQYSPSAADSRLIARVVLDAVARFTET